MEIIPAIDIIDGKCVGRARLSLHEVADVSFGDSQIGRPTGALALACAPGSEDRLNLRRC